MSGRDIENLVRHMANTKLVEATDFADENHDAKDHNGGGEHDEPIDGIEFVDYKDESQLEAVMELVGRDLSEPYSIFTFRYFLVRFPSLCLIAVSKDDKKEPIGCVVGKVDEEEIILNGTTQIVPTGYIGMLAVSKDYRRRGIGKALVQRVVKRMKKMGCTSVTLETEVSNVTAQRLYQDAFGFVREELLVRYYLNFGDAYRLRLWF